MDYLVIIPWIISIVLIWIFFDRKLKKQEEELKFKAQEDEQQFLEDRRKRQEKIEQEFKAKEQIALDRHMKICADLNKQQENLRLTFNDEINNLQHIVDQKKMEMEQNVNDQAQLQWAVKEKEQQALFDQLKKDQESKFQSRRAELEQQELELKQNIEQRRKDFQIELDQLNTKKQDLSSMIDSTISEWQKQEEIEKQKDYYRVILSPEDREDIAFLNSIRHKMNNRDLLSKLIYESYYKAPLNKLLTNILGKETVSGIYRITNITNNKSYIGKSVDVKKRLTDHVKGSLGISTIADQEIHHAMSEEGIEQFMFQLLEQVDKDKLNEREKHYISLYRTQEYGYNGRAGG